MVKELGIRFRPPGRLWDKAAKYGAYKNTKSKWQKLRAIARAERDAKVASKAASALASAWAYLSTAVPPLRRESFC